MADADSLVEIGESDGEQDNDNDHPSAIEADAEDEGVSVDEANSSGRHKKAHKKHKRKAQRVVPDTTSDSDTSNAKEESPELADTTRAHLPVNDHESIEGNNEIPQDAKTKQLSAEKLEGMQRAIELVGRQLQNLKAPGTAPKTLQDATKRKYQFWETQPVLQFDETVSAEENGPIDEDKPVDQIRATPLSLPTGFIWDTLDICQEDILTELYTLLNENYVEDDDNMFRFDYSPEFLKWALQPPGWQKDWHCGVRVAKGGKLVGFISAIPATIQIYDKCKHMVEINFLCVHKKLRAKRVAPVLIREITRRVNRCGLFQAVYTAGVVLPKPVASCRYWHRSLNPKKLIDVKFSHLGRNMTMQRTLKLYRLPDKPLLKGFRPFTKSDLPAAYLLVSKYLAKFQLAPKFTEEEFAHWFLPRPDIIYAYVNEVDGVVKDFISFYSLPSTIMNHSTHKILRAAYTFHMAATSASRTQLMNDALIVAKQNDFDVFNALDLMDNKEFLEHLKFGVGDGNLQYYIYNWKCSPMTSDKVGLVLQ